MKKCDMCHEEFPAECFHKNKRNKDGLHTTCKVCKKKLDHDYRINNPEKVKETKHQYYLENKEEIGKRVRAYIDEHREQYNAYSKKSKDKLKVEVFSHYCGGDIKCQGENCNETNIDILSTSYIHGGGNKFRESVGVEAGYATWQYAKKNNYPNDFTILCANCLWRKRAKDMRPDNPTDKYLKHVEYGKKVKVQCLEHYGGLSCPCGETDLVVLTLDHVNDDGAVHREETSTRGITFYLYLRDNNFPTDPPLQVLCMNCQMLKKMRKYAKQNT